MAMEPDLSHSITMHPHPFTRRATSSQGQNPPVTTCSSCHAPVSLDRSSDSHEINATSTGVEAATAPADELEHPISRHTSTAVTDVERQTLAGLPRLTSSRDPYGLSSCYKSETDLAQMKANTSRKRDGGGGVGGGGGGGSQKARPDKRAPSGGALASCAPGFVRRSRQLHKIQGFYRTQNAAIERMLKSVEEHRAEAKSEMGEDEVRFKIAVWGSFAANVVLAGVQLYAAISSGSLSLFTTMADAIFDPLSNITLILTSRAVKRVDQRRFPAGKARLETVGNIVFCFLMIAVSCIIIAFAARDLSTRDGEDEVNSFNLPSVISVAAAFATKFSLFLYCWALKDRYSQVGILWQDHRNDLFVNAFGILTSVGGSKLKWWIDPMGATMLSVFISALWLRTAFAEFMLLVGVVASVETQQLITYVCLTHSDAVRGIDTVRVYHSGPRLIAEVDIVMDPEGTLVVAHDVAEALQFKLESLPDVERAYVHIDYETTHKPEHALKKDL